MGDTGWVLFTYDKDMTSTAGEVVSNIIQALETVIMAIDHPYVEDDFKRISRETIDHRRNTNNQYMESILSEWFDYSGDGDTISSMSSSDASQSSANIVSLNNIWNNPTQPYTKQSPTNTKE